MADKEHYALWMVPPPECFAHLSALIADLGRHYDTPCFAPHVTLLGGIRAPLDEVVRGLERALADAPCASSGVMLNAGEIACGDAYFRCVYARIDEAEGLTALHEAALARFADAPREAFEPHLSLVYGNLSSSQREAVKARVEQSGGLPCARFEAMRVDVVRINAQPAEWRTVKCAALPTKKG